MKATIKNVRELIAEAETLGNSDSLKTDVLLTEQGLDSLDLVNVGMKLEEKFDIVIPDEDYIQLLTINDIVSYINKQ